MKGIRVIASLLLIVLVTNSNINADSHSEARVDFYGHALNIPYDFGFNTIAFTPLNQAKFNSLSASFRSGKLDRSVSRLRQLAMQYALDDIGISLMLDKFVAQQFSRVRNNEKVFIKYTLLKEMDYDVLLTRSGQNLNCMANLSFVPGRYVFIKYNNKTYTDLDFDKRNKQVKHFIFMDKKKTYKSMSRNPLRLPKISANTEEKALSFQYNGERYEVEARSNGSITEFLEDIPMYDIGKEYSRLSMSTPMRNSLIKYLREQTVGMDQSEKAKFLLAFVQQSVAYGSDFTKYGEERYYYPEQTVMAATADCEDKTFLYAYLLREVARIPSVALYFENDQHLSIGIHLNDFSGNYSFKYKGEYYLACEPTASVPQLGHSSFKLNRVTKVTPL